MRVCPCECLSDAHEAQVEYHINAFQLSPSISCFLRLLQATLEPEKYPNIHILLSYVQCSSRDCALSRPCWQRCMVVRIHSGHDVCVCVCARACVCVRVCVCVCAGLVTSELSIALTTSRCVWSGSAHRWWMCEQWCTSVVSNAT